MLILNFQEQVEEAKKIQRRLNIDEIRNSLSERWAKIKINNHVEKFDGLFTYEDVVEQIKSNDIVASMFCKDPSKQNISEKMAEKILFIYIQIPPTAGRKNWLAIKRHLLIIILKSDQSIFTYARKIS